MSDQKSTTDKIPMPDGPNSSGNPIGKNFSCNNQGQRKPSDFYETPYSMTRQFLDLGCLDPSASTLEPAQGNGAITRVLNESGFLDVTSYDKETDFLFETRKFCQIITNPPYSQAEQFILKAKTVSTSRFALLLPLTYLHGKARYDRIYSDTLFHLKSVYVFTRYPMLGDDLREDGRYRTGMMVYAWYFWDSSYSGKPVLDWIDNHSFVLGARKVVS